MIKVDYDNEVDKFTFYNTIGCISSNDLLELLEPSALEYISDIAAYKAEGKRKTEIKNRYARESWERED